MQFRLPAAIIVFLGSYLPLGIILLAQDIDYNAIGFPACINPLMETCNWIYPVNNPWYSLPILLVTLFSFLASLWFLRLGSVSNQIDVKEVKYIPAELMSYTLPYVVSFMNLEYQQVGKVIGLSVFLMWMFWITHKSGQLMLNPIFVAFGWRLYEVSYSHAGESNVRKGRILSRGEVEAGKRYKHCIIQDIIIVPKVSADGV